jgi:hypothetical protein
MNCPFAHNPTSLWNIQLVIDHDGFKPVRTSNTQSTSTNLTIHQAHTPPQKTTSSKLEQIAGGGVMPFSYV